MSDRLERAFAALLERREGPGGAVAVLREGEVLLRHAWGWANAERRIPFTPGSLFRMCSITKQFTCAALLDASADPAAFDAAVAARLPRLQEAPPRAIDLAHNQSGLRDYWAVAMLLGSPADGPFGAHEAAALIGGTRTLQFAPGTGASYCNQNFRILSGVLEQHAGRGFGEVLRRRVFDRVGMATAVLAADTRAMPDGTEGYEGSVASGFRPAENRIVWTGDAGLGASLDDMIAWERHVDAAREDPDSLYGRIAAPATFRDGTPAAYGFGLARRPEWGRTVLGHGGALRGWRSTRLYAPAERVSVVVLFNHMADARRAALDLLGAVLGETPPPPPERPQPAWLGAYREDATGLSARIEAAGTGRVRLRFGQGAELLTLQADGSASNDGTTLRPDAAGTLWLDRPDERLLVPLQPAAQAPPRDIAGRYRCDELGSTLTVADAGGVLCGAFEGPLGLGRMEALEPIGGAMWALPCPRALDVAPPGDWTLTAGPDSIEVGCWLARRLRYERIG